MAEEENSKKKIGRPKNIENADIMWKHFEDYRKFTKDNPKLVHDFVGKDGDSVYRKKEIPLSMDGFQNYLEDQGVITDVTDYFENKDGRYDEFIRICSRIKRNIRQDQIEGGMIMIYSPSVTQRLNGLVDKKEIEAKHELKIPPVPDIGNRK